MKIVKIKIKNLFGIKEYEADGRSIELTGKNGAGKTSVIDAIRYALTNKSDREYIVRNGETEGEILIETDNGIRIDRKPRTQQTDYKSVKHNGMEVGSPETFLKDIFTTLQLSPVEFMAMDKKQQNAIILDMIEYDWSLQTIKEWFGEIVPDINYEQNILQVLNDIQSEKGYYFMKRQDINRDARNKRAFIEEIAENIPEGYEAEKWEKASLNEIYTEIERIRKENETIDKALQLIENRNNKVRKFEADKEIAIAALDREFDTRANQIDRDIASLKAQIKALETERDGLADKKKDKLSVIENQYTAAVAKYDAEVEEYKEYVGKEKKSTLELSEKAAMVEKMKSHINEYHRMVNLQNEVEDLLAESADLTRKIEKARTLPGEILETATIPIKGLTVKDGVPLINGLPVSNLSDGEKLDLCIDVAIQKPNGLQIILIDGVEKLSTDLRTKLYEKCKSKGLQFIATRTTDDEDLTVVEL
ncbi:AAA family ATPase [Mobilitalea sibirica]|uniref:AAA family ATPase n=1 Tax=Mobilitalea sibirica TaxID=1462919 RepID=A0A8J7H8V2_9FIRM|nr:AAA family ATPase [Mobilitalea sibirica]MBH1941671.1 AAA family ATPase [Mobilitalea sibirica]